VDDGSEVVAGAAVSMRDMLPRVVENPLLGVISADLRDFGAKAVALTSRKKFLPVCVVFLSLVITVLILEVINLPVQFEPRWLAAVVLSVSREPDTCAASLSSREVCRRIVTVSHELRKSVSLICSMFRLLQRNLALLFEMDILLILLRS